MTADLRRLVKTLWNNAALQYNQLILSCPFVYCFDQWFVYEWYLVFASS